MSVGGNRVASEEGGGRRRRREMGVGMGIQPKTSVTGRILEILLGICVTNNILDRYKEKERG